MFKPARLTQGFAAARLFIAVAFNALGLLALLVVAWLMPQFLALIFRAGVVPGL